MKKYHKQVNYLPSPRCQSYKQEIDAYDEALIAEMRPSMPA